MKHYIVLFCGLIGIFMSNNEILASLTDEKPDKNETDANLIGHVVDKTTGEHLAFVPVTIKGTVIYATTDETGHYFLKNLPTGEFEVEVSFLGYKTQTKKVVLEKGKTAELNFEITEDMTLLDGVVVSANRSETTRKMAPTLVNVMTPIQFEQTNAVTVSNALVFQPGVRIENNCQNCGFQQVRINGMDGPYTQILIDSRPIFSALAGVYGIEQLPTNMVDRVEVMRGGGSALFGSSAIAGTINIITKEPQYNCAQISHTFTNYDAGPANENTTSMNASIIADNNKLGIAVFGQNRQRDGYDNDGDGYTELPRINGQTLGTRAYLRTGNYSRLTAEYHHLQETRRGGDQLDKPPHEANIAEEITHSTNTGGVKWEYFAPNERHKVSVFGSLQHIDRNSYYGTIETPEAYGYTTDLTWVAGAQYDYKFKKCLFMPADLTVGTEFTQDIIHDNMPGYNRKLDQSTNIASIFLQNEWKNDKLGILLGGRLDKHNLIKNIIFSPRITLRYNPIDNINIRASYSFGFRAPQAFDEDLHIENVGGTVSMIKLADNLKEEKSQSVNLSVDSYIGSGPWQGNILLEGFFTDLNRAFALRQTGIENGIIIQERYNEKGARVFGGTLEGKVAYKNIWQMQLGLTYQKSLYKEARRWVEDVEATKQMFRTPDLYGYFTTTVTPVKNFDITISGTYTGKMLVEHHEGYIEENRTETTPDFFDMQAKLSYDIKIWKRIILQINAGVGNIFDSYQKNFDQGIDRDSGYIYGPGAPRNFFAGIKLSY